ADPTPAALAEALDRLTSDRGRALSRGETARDLWRNKNVTWEATVRRLLD
ncbi:MAG: glycosyl transferase family 1, partial [Caulobacter sp.]|nr:glycosyl transferase family 1 [Caulobacter sp.]